MHGGCSSEYKKPVNTVKQKWPLKVSLSAPFLSLSSLPVTSISASEFFAWLLKYLKDGLVYLFFPQALSTQTPLGSGEADTSPVHGLTFSGTRRVTSAGNLMVWAAQKGKEQALPGRQDSATSCYSEESWRYQKKSMLKRSKNRTGHFHQFLVWEKHEAKKRSSECF